MGSRCHRCPPVPSSAFPLLKGMSNVGKPGITRGQINYFWLPTHYIKICQHLTKVWNSKQPEYQSHEPRAVRPQSCPPRRAVSCGSPQKWPVPENSISRPWCWQDQCPKSQPDLTDSPQRSMCGGVAVTPESPKHTGPHGHPSASSPGVAAWVPSAWGCIYSVSSAQRVLVSRS